ncbi:hypothetical protein GQ44DRAFT_614235 [Phaeosphaeriaceae sp. PMI808]|nr:hypothetical protein GQ44DRAFT_614235 [Phaeosphaeriaceae sp. PMI808]
MTSSETRATAYPSSPAPTRSLLSRLRSPLSSKSRNFTEFYIQSDDPHRTHAPGDIISGTVILKVIKPLRITHLVVSLHGYAQVFKNPNTPGDAYKNYSTTVGSGKGKKGGSYFGNGFVSLFEDEIVLCGEGCLAGGVYHFNFELEFPSKGLPSSIDFERGTVAYMLTSTLTRPTTISPTTTCEVKVYLADSVDIAPIAEPKQRIISLEPISRRTRTKPPRKRPDPAVADATSHTPNGFDAPQKAQTSESSHALDENEAPRSPSPSDVSYESQMSSGASGTEYGIRSINTATDGFVASETRQAALKGKTITATIDVLKGGFLRGDQIPIKVTVNHTKHVRSLKGIILTLYRQARVDMHPALPVATNSKNDKKKTEDYYPKSRTGLGGLSLSSAGSSHLFRKDLSQSFAPLFVDPRTLTAEVKCAVRVPDEAFPTMSNVPGAMMSFKYYIEVVVDIQGKLTGLDRMVANAGLVNVPSAAGGASLAQDDATGNMFSSWGGNFVDTDQIRREKGVVSSVFEVVIGTKDSDRNGKRKLTHLKDRANIVHDIPGDQNGSSYAGEGYEQDYYDYDENGQYYDYNYDPSYYEVPGYEQYGHGAGPSYHAPLQPAEEEQALSEKERVRRAEARLLPSQPPGIFDMSSSPPNVIQYGLPPSAPMLPEDDYTQPAYYAAGSSSSALAHPPPPFRAASSSSVASSSNATRSLQRRTSGRTDDDVRTTANGSSTTINANSYAVIVSGPTNEQTKPLPPLPLQSLPPTAGPVLEYFSSASSHVQPTDDKQEMQRRRLELERSAPPDEHHDEGESSAQPSAPPVLRNRAVILGPSAPALDEDDEGLVGAVRPVRSATNGQQSSSRSQNEPLPEYQR